MNAAVAERGVDPTRRGSFEDTIADFTSAIFQYDDIATDFATVRDPNWDKEAQANAWEAMNATAQGQYLVKATGMTQERLAELPNQDMVIYSMNRMYNEARFAQHSAQDNWGGMGEIMGQMGAEIVSDIDTVGELGLALAAGPVVLVRWRTGPTRPVSLLRPLAVWLRSLSLLTTQPAFCRPE